jgi:hypothetical protein
MQIIRKPYKLFPQKSYFKFTGSLLVVTVRNWPCSLKRAGVDLNWARDRCNLSSPEGSAQGTHVESTFSVPWLAVESQKLKSRSEVHISRETSEPVPVPVTIMCAVSTSNRIPWCDWSSLRTSIEGHVQRFMWP